MGLQDFADKAKGAFEDVKDKAGDLLNEENTDAALDQAAGLANKVTGGKFADKIDAARDAVDEKLG